MHIELITFDGDDTVWDFEAGMLLGLERVAAVMTTWRLDVDGHSPSIEDLLVDRERVGKEHEGEGRPMEQLRWLALERTLRRAGVSHRRDLVDVLYDHFMEARYAGVRPFDDAPAALKAVGRDRSLALITNGNSHPDQVGLAGIFDLVISAQDRGIWKPDPAIYRLATTELGIEPANALHVGDHQRDDVQAARNAGFMTVWMNRKGTVKETWCCPNAEISSLAELPTILRRLCNP